MVGRRSYRPAIELVQRGAEGRLGGQVAEFVEHQHVAGEQWLEQALAAHRGAGAAELAGQGWAVMKRAVAPSWTCLVAMQIASIVLPRPGGPIRVSVPAWLDEGGVQVAQHDLALEVGAEAEVELLDAGGEGKAGLAQPALGGGRRAPRPPPRARRSHVPQRAAVVAASVQGLMTVDTESRDRRTLADRHH